jgi:hypothetical protein
MSSLWRRERMAAVNPQAIPREYYQDKRDKAYELFIHYSTVRMAIIAFTIPLGAEIMASGEKFAGLLVISLAIMLNWFFAHESLKFSIVYRNLREFLRDHGENAIPDTFHEPRVPAIKPYMRVFVGMRPIKGSSKRGAWASMEPAIQGAILAGSGVLVYLLW